jgi:hypothetical protein
VTDVEASDVVPDVEPDRAPDESQPRLVRSMPPLTSFDLLEGEFAKARKARMLTLVVAAVSCVAVTLVVAQGLSYRVGSSRTQSEVTSTADRVEALRTQLSAAADIAGLSAADANAYIVERSTIAAKLTAAEVDFGNILNQIAASIPPGVTLSGIDYDIVKVPPPNPRPEVAVCPSGTRVPFPAAPAEESGDTSVNQVTLVVTAVMAAGTDFRPWIAAMNNIPELSEVSHQQSGEAPLFALKVNAVVNQFARSPRAAQFENDSGTGATLNPCFDPTGMAPTPLAPELTFPSGTETTVSVPEPRINIDLNAGPGDDPVEETPPPAIEPAVTSSTVEGGV